MKTTNQAKQAKQAKQDYSTKFDLVIKPTTKSFSTLVYDADGEPLAVVNIFTHDSGSRTIDIVKFSAATSGEGTPDKFDLNVSAWDNGKLILDSPLKKMVAVRFNPKQDEKDPRGTPEPDSLSESIPFPAGTLWSSPVLETGGENKGKQIGRIVLIDLELNPKFHGKEEYGTFYQNLSRGEVDDLNYGNYFSKANLASALIAARQDFNRRRDRGRVNSETNKREKHKQV